MQQLPQGQLIPRQTVLARLRVRLYTLVLAARGVNPHWGAAAVKRSFRNTAVRLAADAPVNEQSRVPVAGHRWRDRANLVKLLLRWVYSCDALTNHLHKQGYVVLLAALSKYRRRGGLK